MKFFSTHFGFQLFLITFQYIDCQLDKGKDRICSARKDGADNCLEVIVKRQEQKYELKRILNRKDMISTNLNYNERGNDLQKDGTVTVAAFYDVIGKRKRWYAIGAVWNANLYFSEEGMLTIDSFYMLNEAEHDCGQLRESFSIVNVDSNLLFKSGKMSFEILNIREDEMDVYSTKYGMNMLRGY